MLAFTLLLFAMLFAPATASAISVSGTAYADGSLGTVWGGCGATARLAIAVNGVKSATLVACNATTGAFSFNVSPTAANQVIAIFFDGQTEKAALYTRNADTTTNITGLRLIRATVVIGSESTTGITNADMGIFDSGEDPDVPVTVGLGNVLTAPADTRLHVNTGDTYAPGANTTAGTLRVQGTYAGSSETLVLTNGGSSDCNTTSLTSMNPVCLDGGTFTASAITRLTSSTTVELATKTITFKAVQIQPTAATPTYELMDAVATVTMDSLQIGTGSVALLATIPDGTVVVNGATTLAAATRLELRGGANFHARGDFTGAGAIAVDKGGDVFLQPPAGTTMLFGTTSGSAEWFFDELLVRSSGGTASMVRAAAGGTGLVRMRDDLEIGDPTDTVAVTLDMETNDRAIDVNSSFTLMGKSGFSASSTASFIVGDDFERAAGTTFTPNLGTVTIDTQAQVSNFQYGMDTTFYGLSILTPSKVLRFEDSFRTTVTNLTVDGGACGSRIGLGSAAQGIQYNMNVTGTASVSFAHIADSNAITARSATNSTTGGNNTGWSISGSCPAISISGTMYQDEAGTVWTGCDGVTPNVGLSINGFKKQLTTCSPSTGAYTFGSVPNTGLMMVVFMDVVIDATAGGATYSRAPSPATDVTGVDVTYGRIRMRSETTEPMNHRLISFYDDDHEPNLDINASPNFLTATVESAGQVRVDAGHTYRPEDDVTAGSMDVRGTLHVSASYVTVVMTSGGTSTDCNAASGTQMPFCLSTGGTLLADGGLGSLLFRSASPYYLQGTTYPRVRLEPSASNPAITLGHVPGSTVTVQGELEFTAGAGLTSTAENSTFGTTLRVLGDLDIEAGNTLTGTGDVLVTGDMLDVGTIDMTGGTLEQRVGASKLTGPGGAGNHTYNDVVYSNSSGTNQTINFRSATAGTVRVRSHLTVGRATDGFATTLVNGSLEESIDVDGSVLIGSKGALTAAASTSTPFTIGDDFVNQGTFTASGGRVTLDDASKISSIVTSAPTTFSNLSATTPNETVRFQSGMTTTVTGTLTANGGNCGSPVVLESTSGGSAWTINMGTSAVQYATLRDSTASPARTATSTANNGGNSGWTFSGGCPSPTTMLSHDTDAAGAGVAQNSNILVDTPHFSWINNSGLAANQQRTQVMNTPVDASVLALWHLDGTGVDVAGGGGGNIQTRSAPADATYDSATVKAGFGQSIDVDGDDVAEAAAHSPALDRDTFTVEAWVRLDGLTGPVGDENVIVAKDLGPDNRNFRISVWRTGADTGVAWADVSTGGATVTAPLPLQGTSNLNDGRWHHVAYTVDSAPADPNKVHALYVDGVLEGSGTFSGDVDNPATPLTLGASATPDRFLDGRIDEVRVSTTARTAAELRGYVRTHMPHGTNLWDSDPTDAGVAFTPDCADAARCVDVVYAGPAVVRDGARYHVRGKLKSTTGIWSGWSTWDHFETAAALTLTIPSGSDETLGVQAAGIDATATTDVQVWTNDRNGYALLVTGPSDTAGMIGPGTATIPRWTGTPRTPTNWPAGASGYFGLTVLSATGGKDTDRWGTGTAQGSFDSLNYAGLQQNTPTILHRRQSWSNATDTITTSYRTNTPAGQAAGTYSAIVTYTAIANVV